MAWRRQCPRPYNRSPLICSTGPPVHRSTISKTGRSPPYIVGHRVRVGEQPTTHHLAVNTDTNAFRLPSLEVVSVRSREWPVDLHEVPVRRVLNMTDEYRRCDWPCGARWGHEQTVPARVPSRAHVQRGRRCRGGRSARADARNGREGRRHTAAPQRGRPRRDAGRAPRSGRYAERQSSGTPRDAWWEVPRVAAMMDGLELN